MEERMKFRSLLIVLALLGGGQAVLAASWGLPAGVKSLTVNDYPMAYFERGSGEAIVLVHGLGNDYRVWNAQLEAPTTGFRLIALSLRHYYPERWNGKNGQFSTKQHSEDLAAFIAALDVGPVHLVGHSVGGIIAVRVAQTRPDLIKKLVLMEGSFNSLLPSTKPAAGAVSLPAVRKAARARFEQGDLDGGLEIWVDRDGPGRWKARNESERQMSRDNAWTLVSSLGPSTVTCSDLAGLAMPVLLMQGEKTSPRLARVVEATRKCVPSAEYVLIPDADHSIQRTNPSAFQAALFSFLRK